MPPFRTSSQVFFDLESKAKGTLVDDWPFPKPMINDPTDSKPADWVDETMIDDPEDKKPEGHDDIPAQVRGRARYTNP
jgi:calreticulin